MRKSYINQTTEVMRYLCRKYNYYKRASKTYLNCTMCPASDPETGDCYMCRIINDMKTKPIGLKNAYRKNT